jgi:hypothetical protein
MTSHGYQNQDQNQMFYSPIQCYFYSHNIPSSLKQLCYFYSFLTLGRILEFGLVCLYSQSFAFHLLYKEANLFLGILLLGLVMV